MKSYNHLWEAMTTDENIILAIKNASKGKRNRRDIRHIYEHSVEYVDYYRNLAANFHNAKHAPIEIYDGIRRKKRKIIVPTFDEQVIHHMAVNALKPIIMRPMYKYACGSIPHRGSHKMARRISKWIRNDPRHTKYCLYMDIHRFFDSIPHDILIRKLRRAIHDERYMRLLEEIISVQDVGIPLGFYTSQWFANFYLTDMDHYIKEDLAATYYVRYMDDICIYGPNKRKLHKMRSAIDAYLVAHGLTVKPNWQIYPINKRAPDYMGYRFYRNRTIMRRSIYYRMCRKAKKVAAKDRVTIYDCRQMLAYLGWIKSTDVYGAYLKRIKPYVNIQQMKRYVSRYDRRHYVERSGI